MAKKKIIIDVKEEKTQSKKLTGKHYGYLAVGAVVIIVVIVLMIIQFASVKVKIGDTVSVDYVGKLDNGTIFDTSIQIVGEQAGLNRAQYQPLEFKVSSGQVIKGFDEAVIGMAKGEVKTVVITPENAYGQPDPKLFLQLNRELEIQKISKLDIASYKQYFNSEPIVGKEFSSQGLPWKLKVTKIEGNMTYVENVANTGDAVKLPGTTWDSIVTVMNETLKIIQNPKLGDYVSFPTEQGVVSGKVSEVTTDKYTIDANHPLAGKSLTFEITLREIKS